MRTMMEKIESAGRTQVAINAAIEELMKREGCSRALATDRVCLSRTLSDAVRFEKRVREIEAEARADAILSKANSADSVLQRIGLGPRG